jgi:carbonyl reductase 1
MSTKVAIVTGGNKGVGFATVRGLAKNFTGDVYLTARSEDRGQAAVKELATENLKVHFHQLDIDNEESIKTLAAFIKEKYGGLDLLVNNAAIAFKQAATEPMSVQAKMSVATNYFSVKKTCDLMFPLLRSGARVVNLSSAAGFLPLIPGEDLKKKFARTDSTLTYDELDALMKDFVDSAAAGNHAEKGWPNSCYVASKVGLSAMSRIQQREMDKDLSRSDVAINHVHPGYVDTDMSSHKGPLSIDDGAKASLFAALLPPGTDIKGKYIWFDCQLVDWVNGPKPEKWT